MSFGRELEKAVRFCVCNFCLGVGVVYVTVALCLKITPLSAGLAVTPACSLLVEHQMGLDKHTVRNNSLFLHQ